jgi:hypothetical protein
MELKSGDTGTALSIQCHSMVPVIGYDLCHVACHFAKEHFIRPHVDNSIE